MPGPENSPQIILRSRSVDDLSNEAVVTTLQEGSFFDINKSRMGKGIKHQYEAAKRDGKSAVIDYTTGLMWQKSGSPSERNYAEAALYINVLNCQRLAGYGDWRLPTLEEAMSLMEPGRKSNGLYIDLIFDVKQSWIWTADRIVSSGAWAVNFYGGYCFDYDINFNYCVRAVRC